MADITAVNKESQFAAWVLVHGYRVNHFTALVNSHGVEALDDIDAWRASANDALRPHVGYETALLFIQATLALRLDRSFMRLCARLGLVRYWRESGVWPDCTEEVASAYDFRAEASRHP